MKEKAKQTTAVSKSHTSPTTSTRTQASCFNVTVFLSLGQRSSPPRERQADCSVPFLMLDGRGSLGFTLSGDPGWKTLESWEEHNTDQTGTSCLSSLQATLLPCSLVGHRPTFLTLHSVGLSSRLVPQAHTTSPQPCIFSLPSFLPFFPKGTGKKPCTTITLLFPFFSFRQAFAAQTGLPGTVHRPSWPPPQRPALL